jgi:FlaA1/EpsC-like NDP-sugar epimerase
MCHRAGNRRETIRGILIAALTGLGIYLFYYFTSEPNSLPRQGVASFFLVSSILTLAWRLFYIRLFTAPQFMRRVLLVGGGKAGQALLRVANNLWPPPFYLVGIVDDDPDKLGKEFEGLKVLGNGEALQRILEEQRVSDILVACREMNDHLWALLDQECGLNHPHAQRLSWWVESQSACWRRIGSCHFIMRPRQPSKRKHLSSYRRRLTAACCS